MRMINNPIKIIDVSSFVLFLRLLLLIIGLIMFIHLKKDKRGSEVGLVSEKGIKYLILIRVWKLNYEKPKK